MLIFLVIFLLMIRWTDAQDHPTGRQRYTSKRAAASPASSAPTVRPRLEGPPEDPMDAQFSQPMLGDESLMCWEVTMDLPTSKRGLQRFLEDSEAYVVSQLRRKSVEVSERNLQPDERMAFKEAKAKEIRGFIQSHCFKVLSPEQQARVKSAVGMRWVLTWKVVPESADRKAKARAVILGYQDPRYEHKQTSSPTLSRAGRQLFLSFCARNHFRIKKGDVSSAFLQGDVLEDDMHVVPTAEICEALQIPAGSITRLQRAAYGLVEAPLWWYKTVSNFLAGLGYVRMRSEPCIWVYFDEQRRPRSIISGHVDDFLFGGDDGDTVHQQLMAAIQKRFSWGTWESTPFVQCGVRITQHEDYGFTLDQDTFVETIEPVHINRDRARQLDASTTKAEQSQMRAVLGSLSWACGQVDFVHSADVGFLISKVPMSKVSDIHAVNKLVDAVKHSPTHLRVHGMAKGTAVDLIAWGDAAWANRPDQTNSTEGIVIGLAPTSLRAGQVSPVSLVAWRSTKIDRVCRSPAGAETHAVVDAEDELYHYRYLWSEMNFPPQQLAPLTNDQVVRLSPGMVITDSKNLFDKLSKETPVVKGAERRADIESLSLKEACNDTGVELRWVHSDAQLSNSLTKPSEKNQIYLFLKLSQHWRVIYDESMTSARRRKQQGLLPMDHKMDADVIYDDEF